MCPVVGFLILVVVGTLNQVIPVNQGAVEFRTIVGGGGVVAAVVGLIVFISILAGSRESFNQFRLDYYSDRFDPNFGASHRMIMEKNFQTCRRYALTFAQNAGNLLFVGGTGLGKTFLSACIARSVADRGYSVVYETANHLFGKLEQAKFAPTEESRREAAKFLECDLLIIDDLGVERNSEFAREQVFNIIDSRYRSQLPMIVTTNLTVDELKNPADLARARIYDRVLERCTAIKVNDQNIRKLNIAENLARAKQLLEEVAV